MATEAIQQFNTQQPLVFLLVSSADHITGVTGASPTVTLSKSGGAFAAPSGVVSEVGNGWYQLSAAPGDANTLGPLALHAQAVGADPVDTLYTVVNFSPVQVVPGSPTIITPAPPPGTITFADVWKKIRLYVPGAPVFLVRTWVQDAFRELTQRRQWGWAVYQGQITYQASRAISPATVTVGSTLVTAAPATFINSDAGRQFAAGQSPNVNNAVATFPLYTIQSVATDGSSITLSLPFYGNNATSGSVNATILDAYAVMPSNFGAFIAVVDPINQRFIPWWATQQEMDLIDPARTAADSIPRLLVSASASVFPGTLGQLQYEFWPKPTAAGALQYYAMSRPMLLADTDPLLGLLQSRPDILENGALARAARWPGTADYKNPYFNLALAAAHKQEFELGADQLDLRDDDQYQQSFDTIPWQRLSVFTWAYNTNLLQMTDATLGDYAGFGGWGGGYCSW